MSILDPELFPRRDWIDPSARRLADEIELGGTAASRKGCGPLKALEHWVGGGSFHRYGRRVYDQLVEELGTAQAAVERMHEIGPRLEMKGELRDGHMRWFVSYQRAGDSAASGYISGPAFVEDAAYSALTMIEEHEREVYEQTLRLGFA